MGLVRDFPDSDALYRVSHTVWNARLGVDRYNTQAPMRPHLNCPLAPPLSSHSPPCLCTPVPLYLPVHHSPNALLGVFECFSPFPPSQFRSPTSSRSIPVSPYRRFRRQTAEKLGAVFCALFQPVKQDRTRFEAGGLAATPARQAARAPPDSPVSVTALLRTPPAGIALSNP